MPHFFWHLHKALSDPKLQALDPNNPDTPSLWDIRPNSNWPSVSTQSLLRIFAANADPHLGQGCKLPAGALAVFVRVPDWAGTDDEKFEANDCDILGHVSSCK